MKFSEKFNQKIKQLHESVTTLTVIRVPYGKPDVPQKDREFKLPSTGIVGNTKEWTAFAKKKGYKNLLIVDGGKKTNIKIESIKKEGLEQTMMKHCDAKSCDHYQDEPGTTNCILDIITVSDTGCCNQYEPSTKTEGGKGWDALARKMFKKNPSNLTEEEIEEVDYAYMTSHEGFKDKYDALAYAKQLKKKGWSMDKIEKKIAGEFKDYEDVEYIMNQLEM